MPSIILCKGHLNQLLNTPCHALTRDLAHCDNSHDKGYFANPHMKLECPVSLDTILLGKTGSWECSFHMLVKHRAGREYCTIAFEMTRNAHDNKLTNWRIMARCSGVSYILGVHNLQWSRRRGKPSPKWLQSLIKLSTKGVAGVVGSENNLGNASVRSSIIFFKPFFKSV